MYKIVLIDDEDIVREGMRDLIPWAELGLEMAGDAQDGEEGLKLIDEQLPHIVFLDINMPKVDGIKVAQKVLEKYPSMKIVLITGYEEFSYAREALRLGVEDYILKPVTKQEVIELLKKLVEKLDREQQEEKIKKYTQEKIKQSNEILLQRCIEELILNEIENSLIEKRCTLVEIPLNKAFYSIALIDYDHFLGGTDSNEDEITFFAIQNIIEEILDKNKWGYAFKLSGLNGIFYYTNEKEDVYEHYKKHLGYIKDMLTQYLGITVTIGAGKMVSSIDKVYLSYENAYESLMSRFFLGNNQIIMHDSHENIHEYVKANEWIKWEEKLVGAIENSSAFEKVLDEICIAMERSRMPIEKCQEVWKILAISLFKKFVQIEESIIEVFPDTFNIIEELYLKKTIKEIRDWIVSLYSKCNYYIKEQVSPNKNHIKNALRFLEENYYLSDLSINMVCKEVYLSPSYLSSIFKKATGYSFIEYLTKYRLEKAKELLKYTSLKTYQVAEKVGYLDPQYFSTLFKKQFHKTPSEYRKMQTEK